MQRPGPPTLLLFCFSLTMQGKWITGLTSKQQWCLDDSDKFTAVVGMASWGQLGSQTLKSHWEDSSLPFLEVMEPVKWVLGGTVLLTTTIGSTVACVAHFLCISFMRSRDRVRRKKHGVKSGGPKCCPFVTWRFPDSILQGRLSSPTCRHYDPFVP